MLRILNRAGSVARPQLARPALARPALALRHMSGAPPRMVSRRRWPWVAIGLVAASFGAWKWYTWHHYPESVAKILKKGLMAEINGGGYRIPDRKLALRYYIEALQEADKLMMNPVSDEYTGIQLKIAEMYEHLGMSREAAYVYMEVTSMYLVALNSKSLGALNRDHIIKRDQMVSIMLGLVLKDPLLSRKMLAPHMEVALGRAAENSQESLPVSMNPSLLLDFHEGLIPKITSKISSENEAAWSEFRDEAFALREIMTVACIEQGDFWQAALIKYHTTLLMLSSGFGVGECLLSLNNVGSLACLEAINFQTTGTDLVDTSVPNTEGIIPKTDIKAEVPPGYISLSSLDMIKTKTDTPSTFLELSEKYFSSVRTAVESLKGSQRRAPHVDDAYVLAIYGQGVVAFKQGDLDRASELLHEARLRARGCELEDILDLTAVEIDKLDRIRASGRPITEFTPDQLPQINIGFWNTEAPKLARGPDSDQT